MSLCIFSGTTMSDAVDYAVSVDSNIVFDGLTFMQAISLLFCSYYVFNIEYPVEAKATLEFIQRCVFNLSYTVVQHEVLKNYSVEFKLYFWQLESVSSSQYLWESILVHSCVIYLSASSFTNFGTILWCVMIVNCEDSRFHNLLQLFKTCRRQEPSTNKNIFVLFMCLS